MLRELRQNLQRQVRDPARQPAPVLPAFPVPPLPPTAPIPAPAALTAAEVAQWAAVTERLPRFAESLRRLNPHQLRAVIADDPAALVRAQVGSGKTAVLVHKVLWQHLVCGVPMHRMAVLTFTHKAAGEIRNRIEALAAETATPLASADFWLTGTFHGVARALLRQVLPIADLGWAADFAVQDEAARVALCEQVIAEEHLTVRYRNRLPQRLEALRRGQTRSGAMRHDDDIAALAQHLAAAKKARNLLDFDDLLTMATWLLGEHALAEPPLWLIVDEFQDCDPQELAFITALRSSGSAPPARFFAVGDPHQVIYAWRGSSPQLFDAVQREFGCACYDLPHNYRSTEEILHGAQAVLGWQGAGAALASVRGGGQKIRIRRHHNAHVEGLYLAERMRELIDRGVRPRQIAVLFRMRRQAEAMFAVLQQAGIPCLEPARASALESPAVRYVEAILRLAVTTTDAASVRSLLVHPRFGLLAPRQCSAAALARFTRDQPAPATSQVLAFLEKKPESSGRRFAATHLARWLQLPAWLAAADMADAETQLFAHLELGALLRPTSAQHDADKASVIKWLGRLWQWQRSHGESGVTGLRAALDLMALGGPSALGETADPARDGVALTTLHAAKGLEFQHVFISGCNHGLVPLHSAADSADGDAEERRLLFVGMTRAKDSVELSYHNQPFMARALPIPSPYLYQLPAATVEWDDAPRAAAPQRPAEACAVAPALAHDGDGDSAVPWPVGLEVRHPRYGSGTVCGGDADAVEVRFAKWGDRSFSRILCPLARISAGPT